MARILKNYTFFKSSYHGEFRKHLCKNRCQIWSINGGNYFCLIILEEKLPQLKVKLKDGREAPWKPSLMLNKRMKFNFLHLNKQFPAFPGKWYWRTKSINITKLSGWYWRTKIQYYKVFKALRSRIFFFNCEHFLFVYSFKQKQKTRGFYKKKLRGFSRFNENQILFEAHFWNFDHL